MCLGYTGGFFTLGGVDDSFSGGPMTFTPLIKDTYYVVEIEEMLVGDINMNLPIPDYNGEQSIVDSGTTLLILNAPAFDAFVSILDY